MRYPAALSAVTAAGFIALPGVSQAATLTLEFNDTFDLVVADGVQVVSGGSVVPPPPFSAVAPGAPFTARFVFDDIADSVAEQVLIDVGFFTSAEASLSIGGVDYSDELLNGNAGLQLIDGGAGGPDRIDITFGTGLGDFTDSGFNIVARDSDGDALNGVALPTALDLFTFVNTVGDPNLLAQAGPTVSAAFDDSVPGTPAEYPGVDPPDPVDPIDPADPIDPVDPVIPDGPSDPQTPEIVPSPTAAVLAVPMLAALLARRRR